MVRHWTPKPVIICSIRSNPTGGNFFFAAVKSFEYKIAISANFVQTVKNSYVPSSARIVMAKLSTEGNILHLSVILFTGGGLHPGGVSIQWGL